MEIGKKIRRAILSLAAVTALGGAVSAQEEDGYEDSTDVPTSVLIAEDGRDGSVVLTPNLGPEFEADSLKVFRDGEIIGTFSANNIPIKDYDIKDGKVYTYETAGIDSTGKLTGSVVNAEARPYDEKFNWGFEIDAEDTRFDNNGNLTVKPSFRTGAKGNRVNGVRVEVRNPRGPGVIADTTFSDLDEARRGFDIYTGNGDVYVEGELLLDQGENPLADSGVVSVEEDIPQLILGVIEGRKAVDENYEVKVTKFSDVSQTGDLETMLSNTAIAGTDNVEVEYDGTNANDLVGNWLTRNGNIVSRYRAFNDEGPIDVGMFGLIVGRDFGGNVGVERIFPNGVGIGFSGGYQGDPELLVRSSYGNDKWRIGGTVGNRFTDEKTSIPMGISLQRILGNGYSVGAGLGTSDVGRLYDETIHGDGFNALSRYGTVSAMVGREI